tara:strand:- start:1226 stop:1633 length:408 start_codon:yes stop_codon:yes gene_type:complete
MRNENIRIPLIMSGAFLLASPIFQWIFGLCGGFIIYSVSELTELKTNEIATEIMGVLGMLGIAWFVLARSTGQKWISTFITLFSICNVVLFFSISGQKEYFYPDRYLIGSLLSSILLCGVGLIKRNQQLTKPKLH